MKIREMAGKAFVKGCCSIQYLQQSHFVHICFQTAHWSWAEARRLDETIPMKRIWVKTTP